MKTKNKPILRRVNRDFQITLPPEFRRQTGLNAGDHVQVMLEDNRLIITPATVHRQQLADELAAALAEPVEGGEIENDEESMQFAIEQVRQHRAERRKKSQTKS